MNNAAKLLIEKPELSILDVAVEYGYSSHEAFTRAFCKVWKCNPMEYRKLKYKRLRPFDFFPQITGVMQLEGENFMRRSLDISELYDFIKERKDCYFVCGLNDLGKTISSIVIGNIFPSIRVNDSNEISW